MWMKPRSRSRLSLLALQLLNERYGITEADFFRAEIELVPAHKASDVGLDRSMIGAYGQDDRVCAYTALMAEIETENPVYTTVTILTDKEEIGSVGNTGLNSDYVASLCGRTGGDTGRRCETHTEEFHLFILRCECSL